MMGERKFQLTPDVGLQILLCVGLSLLLGLLLGWMKNQAHAQMSTVPPSVRGAVSQYQPMEGQAQESNQENVMIILDDSDSMSDSIGNSSESKMVAAKRAVLEVVRGISPNTRVGLRIYGNSASPFTACHATKVLVPLGQNNRNLIASKLIGLEPTGMTPISYTIVRSLNEDFINMPGRKSIILISDGMETCGEDPCNIAVKMQQMGVNVKINVVGFGLQDYEATKQLRCVALGTKGRFYSANTAAELVNSLNQAMAVETKVQGTILTPHPSSNPVPVNSGNGASPTPESAPVQMAPGKPATRPEIELPAAVPLSPGKR